MWCADSECERQLSMDVYVCLDTATCQGVTRQVRGLRISFYVLNLSLDYSASLTARLSTERARREAEI